MTFTLLHDRLARFLARLERLDTAGQHDAMVGEILETGGHYDAPPDTSPRASHLFEIRLHGISALGTDEADAIRNWIRAARTHIDAGLTAAL